jgi:hypothetical protein
LCPLGEQRLCFICENSGLKKLSSLKAKCLTLQKHSVPAFLSAFNACQPIFMVGFSGNECWHSPCHFLLETINWLAKSSIAMFLT